MATVLVIGGGPAGMMAAGIAAARGHQVELYEKNPRLGKKLAITGKGRCNLTNARDVTDMMEQIPRNASFLYSAFYGLDSDGLQAFFHDLGVPTKVERGGRVFPVSDRALDVVDALARFLKKSRVRVHLDTAVDSLLQNEMGICGLRLQNGKEVAADAVILATGGLSYPACGSTGDGYPMARAVGHTVTKLYPALTPLRTEEDWCADLMGLSLKNTLVTLCDEKGHVLSQEFGEMLFTHFGVSGPAILRAGRAIARTPEKKTVLTLDLKPALDEKALDARLLRDFEKYKNKAFKNALDDLLPQKMIPVIIALSGIAPEKKVHSITKAERQALLAQIKSLTLHPVGNTGYGEAVVTTGGIAITEINPGTMESKLAPGLYFAGELIDVDGYTGGYNLQIAFSTGYAAGNAV